MPTPQAVVPGHGYRPHLDGLRMVAVYLVVLFHAGSDRFLGGFIGVDVFFVLSGYLVTQLLLRDVSGHGRIRFARFYARRFRRLLPASFAALVITAIAYSAVASPAQVDAALDSFRAAFFYVANWYFIHQSADYFAADIETSPVVHFWSLAVEEQFYLLAPLLLGGLFAITRRPGPRSHRIRQLVIAGGALASVVLALSLSGTNLTRAYYGTDTRAYQLLAGALLALTPGLVARASRYRVAGWAAPALLVGLVLLASSTVDLDPIQRGILAATVTASLIVSIEAAPSGIGARVLSLSPIVYLGQISYGIYLWHWPVIVVTRELITPSPISMFAIAALLGTGLASLSYHLLERPIREQRVLNRLNPAVIGTGLALSAVGGLLIIPRVLDTNTSAPVAEVADTTGFTPMPPLDLASAQTNVGDLSGVALVANCEGKPSEACTVVRGGGEHLLVIGDSHAQMLFPMFAKLAQEHDLTLSTASSGGCPWQQHLYLGDDGGADDQRRIAECLTMRKDLYERVIPELDPDVVVVASRDYLTRRPGVIYDDRDRPIQTSSPDELASLMADDSERSLAALEEVADRVVIVEPMPIADSDANPFDCLSESEVLEACRFVANQDVLPIESIYRDLADDSAVWVADFDKLACPFLPICDPVVNGRITRFDYQHLAPAYAVELADEVATYLQEAGIVHTA